MTSTEQIKNEIAKRNNIQPDADEASIPCSTFQIETVERELVCKDKFRARIHQLRPYDARLATFHNTIEQAQQRCLTDCKSREGIGAVGLPDIYWMESRSMLFGYVWERFCTGSLLLNLPISQTGFWKLKYEIHRVSSMQQTQTKLR